MVPLDVHRTVLSGASGRSHRIALRRTFDQHALRAADHRIELLLRDLILERLQDPQPIEALLLIDRRLDLERASSHAFAVREGESSRETDLPQERERQLEVFVRLAREADDDV